ncbi:MAG: HTH domain-containing protein [Peptostreptococcaceae bacterium]|nr:HTH domain-containing protein [Peptostreptococcaceae bacterium]MDY5738657.1 HTH domain-containing protein [Anaerovoracaceae bacterium]
MHKNLNAEMARYEITVSDIAKLLSCSERTVKNKISGITPFTYKEAITIRNEFFNNLETEYLFEQ